ncbi:MAG: response regulator transcription factor [Desulfoferrobacter sp.]
MNNFSADKPLRVFLADDHPLLRMALRLSLTQKKDIEVVGEASDGYSTVEKIQSSLPDIAVIDVEMPGLTGIRAIRILRRTLSTMKIVVLSTYNKEEYIRDAIQAGADGYILKRVGIDELVRIIRGFGDDQTVISPYLVNLALGYDPNQMQSDQVDHPLLTHREKEVLQGLTEGRSNKEISNALNISTETVKSHIKHIYGKLNVKSRLEAARIAREMNLID